jgi:hypothetical protein
MITGIVYEVASSKTTAAGRCVNRYRKIMAPDCELPDVVFAIAFSNFVGCAAAPTTTKKK